jgi:alkylation response protein AidB-like acyl-CoA dehydrogenase
MTTVSAIRTSSAPTTVVTPGSAALGELVERIRREADAAKRAGRSLHGVIDVIREARFGAFRVPLDEGGGGASLREFFAAIIDLAHADPDVPHILRAHYWYVEERLRSANGAERARWLDLIVRGDIFGNAMSELGGPAAVGNWQFTTTIVPDGDGYRLNGEKYYCTGSLYSDWVNVFGVLPDGALASAVVPVGREGVTFDDDWDGIGQKLTGSGSGHFHNVRVAKDELLRSAVDTEEAAQHAQSADPYLIGQFCQLILTAIIAGILRSVVDDAVRLLHGRARTYTHAAGATPATDPLLQTVVGELSAAAFAAEAAVLAAAQAQDDAINAHPDVALELAHRGSLRAAQAKVFVDEIAQRASSRLFDVGGSSAVKSALDLDRHWRNVRTLASHNPTAYKARAIGDYLVSASWLPNSGFF